MATEAVAASYPTEQPSQQQEIQPGLELAMISKPVASDSKYQAGHKLAGKAALVTGGDSGISRAVTIVFAKEGADVAVAYLNEHRDAEETKRLVETASRRCLLIPSDSGQEANAKKAVEQTVSSFGKIDILIKAAEPHPQKSVTDTAAEQPVRTSRTNLFAYFFTVKAAAPPLKEGETIISTCSVTASTGAPQFLGYSATKGAIVAFTRSRAQQLIGKNIRVHSVAPGPVWTPLIPSTFPPEEAAKFGADVPMKRAGQPEEIANSYVFLASNDLSYVSGQTLHPNGGEVVHA